jgi:hypothetical protein
VIRRFIRILLAASCLLQIVPGCAVADSIKVEAGSVRFALTIAARLGPAPGSSVPERFGLSRRMLDVRTADPYAVPGR